jgi:hypothetical protein
MARYISLRIRPYRVYKSRRRDRAWVVWDHRHVRFLVGPDGAWLHPTHAAAIAALDAHLREQAATEPTA